MSISKDDPRVELRLKEAEETGALDLSHLQLTHVPSWLAEVRIDKLTTLTLSFNRLTTLKGVKWPRGLSHFSCCGNHLATLEGVVWPTTLTNLTLSQNRITALDSTQWPESLIRLVLNNNLLTTLKDVSWPNSLTYLYLNGNRLSSIDGVRWPTKLKQLLLNNNALSTLSGAAWPNGLRSLRLSNNFLLDLEGIKWPKKLTSLSLNENKLNNINTVAFPNNLTLINLVKNNLSNVDGVAWPSGLRTLYLFLNPALMIPADLLEGGDAQKIIAWLRQQEGILPEIKVAVLGEGEVGKSTLVRRLVGRELDPEIDRTVSFEWHPLQMKLAPSDALRGEKVPDEAEITFNIFDFGGQARLRTAHQFFMSNRRTIYLLVANAKASVEENRLRAWADYITQTHEQWLRLEAISRVKRERRESQRRVDERGEGSRLESDPKHEEQEIAATIEELRQQRPMPPMHVVLTQCQSLTNARERQNYKLNIKAIEELAKELGISCTVGCDSVDQGPVSEAAVQDIHTHLAKLASGMFELWRERYPKSFAGILRRFADRFGFEVTKDDGADPHDKPGEAWLSIEDARKEIAGAIAKGSGDETIDAETYLAVLRSLGIVHWVGDRADVSGDLAVKEKVMNPRWVRGPVYDLLWAGQGRKGLPVVSEGRLIEILRGTGDAKRTKRMVIGSDPARVVKQLMEACGLVIRAEGRSVTGELRYVVPDWLEDAKATARQATEVKRWTGGYVDRAMMASLLARLVDEVDEETAARMSSFAIRSSTGYVEARLLEPTVGESRYQVGLFSFGASSADVQRISGLIETYFRDLKREEERQEAEAEQARGDLAHNNHHGTVPQSFTVAFALEQIQMAGIKQGTLQHEAAEMMAVWCSASGKELDWSTIQGKTRIGEMLEAILKRYKSKPGDMKERFAETCKRLESESGKTGAEKFTSTKNALSDAWDDARKKLGFTKVKGDRSEFGSWTDDWGNRGGFGDENRRQK